MAGEALSQADVAEVIAAEVMSALGVDVDSGPLTLRSSPSQSPSRPREPRAKPSTLLPNQPAFLAALLENLESADPIELDVRLRRALRIEQRLLSEMAPLLLEVARSRGYRSRGCSSLAVFARERLGMSPRKAQALLRLERAGDLCPELRAAFRGGALSWVQAHALVPILELEHSQPWRAAWVAHAAAVSVRRLEEDVERALVTGQLDPGLLSEDVQTGAHPAVPGETIKLFFTAPADVARLFKSFSRRSSGGSSGKTVVRRARARRSTRCWSTASRPGSIRRGDAS